MVERRDGPSWLRDEDDDDDEFPQIRIQQVSNFPFYADATAKRI